METKKEAVFRLLAEGYSPSSPEVKALGLKSQTRATYAWEYNRGKGGGSTRLASSGESVGGIDETKNVRMEATTPKTQDQREAVEAEEGGLEEDTEDNLPEDEIDDEDGAVEDAEAKAEGVLPQKEAIGQVTEAGNTKSGNGKSTDKEKKIATKVSEEGIVCKVILSRQTLVLHTIAKATQAQFDGDEALTLGDFLDVCAEDFYKVRGKKLGLIQVGGNND